MTDRTERSQPLLYYRTMEQIERFRKVSIEQKFRWLQMQMEFYHSTMSDRARKIRDRITEGGLDPGDLGV
jgi:hypothetical protein